MGVLPVAPERWCVVSAVLEDCPLVREICTDIAFNMATWLPKRLPGWAQPAISEVTLLKFEPAGWAITSVCNRLVSEYPEPKGYWLKRLDAELRGRKI